MLTLGDRETLEDVIVRCSVCSEECCRIAIDVLPLVPFRSWDNECPFYWTVAQLSMGKFDGIQNPLRLEKLIGRPEEDFWHPQMYDLPGFRALCEILRDEIDAEKQALALARREEASRELKYVFRYWEELVGVKPPPESGLLLHFRR